MTVASKNSTFTKSVIGRFSGTLGPRNSSDDYTLNVARQGIFSASLTGLRNNASLQLRTSSGQIIARSNRPGRQSELIRRNLGAGTYLIRVLQGRGRTRYALTISDDSNIASPTPNPAPVPNPTPTPLPSPTPPANPFQNLWGVYSGIAETSIGTIDPLSGQLTSASTFRTSVNSVVREPRSAGGVVETNPFSLSISSSPAEIAANVEGAISVNSALPFGFRGGFLLQYWNLQYDNSQIAGVLINRDSGTALTTNLFISTMGLGLNLGIPFPYAMDVGTTLQGALTPTELRVRIQGFDLGRTRFFVSDIIAQRT